MALGLTQIGNAQSSLEPTEKPNWNQVVEETDGGHLFGNPDADVKITEFVSYTCPHCAAFAEQGDPSLKLVYIPSGRVSVEVRHLIRDPIDWTAALVANCGPAEKFDLNHALIMREQSKWLAIAQKAGPAQIQRWQNTDPAAARRAIASDLKFYDMMIRRRYSRVDIDRCLSDDTAAAQLVVQSNDEAKRMEVSGTPSFALNGTLLEGTHSWPALETKIKEFLTELATDSAVQK